MDNAKHLYKGATTGNFLQPPGRHREFGSADKLVGLLPLGSRDRVRGRQIHLLGDDELIDRFDRKPKS